MTARRSRTKSFGSITTASLAGSQVARVDFTNSAANLHAGYVADTGQTYGVQGANGTYGWLNASTLAPTTNSTGFNDAVGSAPFNEPRYRSAVQFPTNRIWEYALPDGVYDVHIASADAGFTNMINNMSVEGQLLQDDDFVLNAGTPGPTPSHDEFYARVAVTDGRLTLATAAGVTNARLAYIDINRVLDLTTFLSGDYNLDGSVDAADYTVWRNTLGNQASPFAGADGDGSGFVDMADHGVWKSTFGMTQPASAGGSGAVVVGVGRSLEAVPPDATISRSAAKLKREAARAIHVPLATNRRLDNPPRYSVAAPKHWTPPLLRTASTSSGMSQALVREFEPLADILADLFALTVNKSE